MKNNKCMFIYLYSILQLYTIYHAIHVALNSCSFIYNKYRAKLIHVITLIIVQLLSYITDSMIIV